MPKTSAIAPSSALLQAVEELLSARHGPTDILRARHEAGFLAAAFTGSGLSVDDIKEIIVIRALARKIPVHSSDHDD